MLRSRVRVLVAIAAVSMLLPSAPAFAAEGPPVGGCPTGHGQWQLLSLEELNISPETATGIPSLDGNDDGYTCIKPLPNNEPFIIFRDNTVRP